MAKRKLDAGSYGAFIPKLNSFLIVLHYFCNVSATVILLKEIKSRSTNTAPHKSSPSLADARVSCYGRVPPSPLHTDAFMGLRSSDWISLDYVAGDIQLHCFYGMFFLLQNE